MARPRSRAPAGATSPAPEPRCPRRRRAQASRPLPAAGRTAKTGLGPEPRRAREKRWPRASLWAPVREAAGTPVCAVGVPGIFGAGMSLSSCGVKFWGNGRLFRKQKVRFSHPRPSTASFRRLIVSIVRMSNAPRVDSLRTPLLVSSLELDSVLRSK